ncbi:MAG: NBR1-Ig-like domain-containing protein [Anaerolineales bacterium]|nr:NBR1-Ig-like domain-containing protein [Anaerolineales bacterium]
MIRRNYRAFVVLVITGILLACVPTLVPGPAPISTFDPNSINTVIALTAEAAATQTALMLPPTPLPTATALPASTDTPTPTPTFLFLLPTITVLPTLVTPGSSGAKYECQLLSQNPQINSNFAGDASFDMTWQVANIGRDAWFSSETDYRYSSGARIHKASIYDLPFSVLPGGTIDLKVKMKAPAEPGTYKTEWTISVGKNWFCPLKLTIIVN